MVGFLSYDFVNAFASLRNKELSFPFLKENGELLCIASKQGLLIEPRGLALYEDFYSKTVKLVELYPQFYRFILGLTLDLEAVGMSGNISTTICQHVRANNLLTYDTSDIRRLEALHLLEQSSNLTVDEVSTKEKIQSRLQSFTETTEHFSKFNRPLFYDLTHMVFFLTNYGRKGLIGFDNLENCLLSVGTLSILDNDIDLLAEVVLCLKYIDATVPPLWSNTITEKQSLIEISYTQTFTSSLSSAVDDYHIYFVLNWCLSSLEQPAFNEKFNGQSPSFKYHNSEKSLLAKYSQYAHNQHMSSGKSFHMLEGFMASLGENECSRLNEALSSNAVAYDCLRGFSSEDILLAA